jgi:hypothetical protein
MADYWKYHNNSEFEGKVKHEMQTAAIAVMAEDAQTAGHALRVEYAKSILDGSASVTEMAIGVLTNATVKTHVTNDTDYTSDLAFVVQSLFNAYAGVSN